MGIETSVEKLDKYFGRLEQGKAQKIKPSHVEKVIAKLEAKTQVLVSELAEAEKESKRLRLERKIEMARDQLRRARWLLEEISKA